MKISRVKSLRMTINDPCYDLVFEWEDQICKTLNASLWNDWFYKMIHNVYLERMPEYKRLIKTNRKTLMFDMLVCNNIRANQENVIPWIIDFYLHKSDLQRFNKIYRNNPLVLVSCKDACDFIEKNRELCPEIKYMHLPLTLPDKYAIDENTVFHKKYDVVLAGSKNPVLYSYLKEYANAHPSFTYVDREVKNGHFCYFDNNGVFVGYGDTRDEYISLMKKSRVGLYATHWLDYKQETENIFYHMTPRFLEMLSCGMHVIARFKKNSDTDFFEIEKFSPSIESYDSFEKAMDFALSHDVDMKRYSDYLSHHYTSVRAMELKNLLDD